MNKDNLVIGAIIILLVLSTLPFWYRRSAPKRIWYISLSSAGMIGVFIGCMAPFPINIVVSILLAGVFIGFTVLMWLPTKHWRK
jgi:hypothetical protein